MQINLPPETVELANSLTTDDKDAAAVISEALAKMARERREVAAVMEGIADYEAGRHRPYEEFAAEIFAERGITPER